jgi:putative transposase
LQGANCRFKKTGKNPTDRFKQGVKRSVLTDSRGIPIGIVIAPANWHDSTILVQTIRSIPVHRPRPTRRKPQHICLDKGYDADWIRVVLSVLGFIPHIPLREFTNRKLQSHHSRRKKPKRWVVERSHSWLNRYRGILVRWEKKPEDYLALIHLVAGVICFKKIGIR